MRPHSPIIMFLIILTVTILASTGFASDRLPASARIQSSGNVWIYDQNGNYLTSVAPFTGRASSVSINGNFIIVQTDNRRTLVYEYVRSDGSFSVHLRSSR
jgi:hypothetical protein